MDDDVENGHIIITESSIQSTSEKERDCGVKWDVPKKKRPNITNNIKSTKMNHKSKQTNSHTTKNLESI